MATASPEITGTRARPACWLERLFLELDIAGEIETPAGEVIRPVAREPRFRVKFHRDDLLAHPHDEFSLAQAYVRGDLEIDGDVLPLLDIRQRISDSFRLEPWLRVAAARFLASPLRVNRQAIEYHYGLDNELFLSFLDSRWRMYSHGIFRSDDETLEQASERKLRLTFEALELRPGMHLLDNGAGWGCIFDYCCPRGVEVTGLTLAKPSAAYVAHRIREKRLHGRILLEDFLEHRPGLRYDAIVSYGVIEHIPFYDRYFARAAELLKPGGRIYVDAAACRQRLALSQFTRHYTWHGCHDFMSLGSVIRAVLQHGFEIVEVKEETHDYALTMLGWARNFEQRRKQIVACCGEQKYRAFRLYLWGGAHAFLHDQLQAHHLVARKL